MPKFSNKLDLGLMTQKTYDSVAENFTKSRLKKDKIVELFFKHHKPKDKILDLGCGSGRALIYLNKQGFLKNPKNSYLGIDYSAELLKLAKKYSTSILTSMKAAQIKFKKQNLLNLNLKDKFDYILALASLHHLEPKNHPLVFERIYETLKNNGKFIGYVWSPDKTQISKWTKIGDQEYLKPWNDHSGPKMLIHLFKKDELKNLLKSAGFKNIKVKIVGKKIKKNLFFKATK